MIVYWGPALCLEDAELETVTKSAAIAEACRSIDGVELVAPRPADREELLAVHAAAYIDAVETGMPIDLAESSGVGAWSIELRDSVMAGAGAMRDAVGAATGLYGGQVGPAGALVSGLHHARRGRGAGFCTLNGIALAVREALRLGADSVGVLDLDAHFGGGTAELVADVPRVRIADVSVDRYDYWEPQSAGHLVELVTQAVHYLGAVERALEHLAACELVIYNAGMDPWQDCPIGGLVGLDEQILAQREDMVAQARVGRATVFCPAGGYASNPAGLATIVDLHARTVAAFAAG